MRLICSRAAGACWRPCKQAMHWLAETACASLNTLAVRQVLGGVRDAAIIGGLASTCVITAAKAAVGAAVGAVAGGARALLSWPFA